MVYKLQCVKCATETVVKKGAAPTLGDSTRCMECHEKIKIFRRDIVVVGE